MRALALFLPWLVLLAACLGPAGAGKTVYKDRTITAVIDSGVLPANRTGAEFYVIWIAGGENTKRTGGQGDVPEEQCDRKLTVEYDAGNGVLRYDGRRHPIDTRGLQILVALQYRGDRVYADAYGRDCAMASNLTAFDGRASFEQSLRADLDVRLVAEPQNGFLTYNSSYFIPVGKKIHVNLTRVERMEGGHSFYVTGDFEVVNLGLWTTDRLVAR